MVVVFDICSKHLTLNFLGTDKLIYYIGGLNRQRCELKLILVLQIMMIM